MLYHMYGPQEFMTSTTIRRKSITKQRMQKIKANNEQRSHINLIAKNGQAVLEIPARKRRCQLSFRLYTCNSIVYDYIFS